ncbi:MAG: beta-propeller domain-containing protein, partial [Clostridia bacterium]|nr:beta-propeller domain-containing protein [Clostridia bacterium]
MRTCEERTRDVLERRDAYRKKQQRRQSAVAFGTLCGALILSVCLGTLPRFGKPTVESYDAVFEAVKAQEIYFTTTDDGEIYYEYAEDTSTGTANQNTGKPGATRPTAATQATALKGTSSDEHSETNLQVAGVDEADIVKTDGRYLYVLSGERVVIVDPNDGKPQAL